MKQYKTIKPTRLKNYDYSLNGYYFITICTHEHANIFGRTINNEISVGADGCRPSIDVKLNEFGLIVNDELKNSEIIRNEIKLNDHIIMPNHIHAIVIIQNNIIKGRQPSAPTDKINQKQSLSSFVAGFKSVVTKRINTLRNTPGNPVWQRSFYDHIIRTNESLNNIRQYIVNNPATWDNDENNINSIEVQAGLNPTGQ